MAEIQGLDLLNRRIAAVQHPKGVAKLLGLATVREAKLLVHRKTGNLGRSIHVSSSSETHVTVTASARYAADVELGTRPHTITPRAKKALAWAPGPAGGQFRRLSGASRVGNTSMIFAKVVHHPGTKPYPYLVPGAKRAVAKSGLRDVVVDLWNGAA